MMADKRARRQQQLQDGIGAVEKAPTASLAAMDSVLFDSIHEDTGLSVARSEDGSITIGNFTLGATGLIVADGATFDEWESIGGVLRRLEGSIQWQIGDWINYGESNWGEKYERALETEEYAYQTLRVYASVAGSIDLLIRNQQLSFAHHRLIAPDAPELQKLWLEYAALHQNATRGKYKLNDMKRERGVLVEFNEAKRAELLRTAIASQQRATELPEVRKRLAAVNPKPTWHESHLKRQQDTVAAAKKLTPHERRQLIELWEQTLEQIRQMK